MAKKTYGLSNDYLFKRIFSNKEFLKQFMNDVFEISLDQIYYRGKEFTKENKNLSFGVCDLVLEYQKELIIIEMQNEKKPHFEQRCMAYLSKLYIEQWEENDYQFKPITICWVLNYSYTKKELSEYKMLETKIYEVFGDVFNIKIWCLKKVKQTELRKQYIQLFNTNEKKLNQLEENPKLKPLVHEIRKYNLSKEEYKKMKEAEKMWTERDEHKIDMMIAYDEGKLEGELKGRTEGKKEGKIEGKKEGKKEGINEARIETAKNLLSSGVSIDIIAASTKLSKKQIMKYQNS